MILIYLSYLNNLIPVLVCWRTKMNSEQELDDF